MSTSAPRGTGELSLRARPHLASTACALRQHPASTPCVNSLRQHPASTPCCSQGPLQRKSSISFVPGAHYKGNLQFPLFPGPTTKEILNFLCSRAHYKGNLQFPLFPEPTTKEICSFLCSQGTILRQHPASTAGVHRCPKVDTCPQKAPYRSTSDLESSSKLPRQGGSIWEHYWMCF